MRETNIPQTHCRVLQPRSFGWLTSLCPHDKGRYKKNSAREKTSFHSIFSLTLLPCYRIVGEVCRDRNVRADSRKMSQRHFSSCPSCGGGESKLFLRKSFYSLPFPRERQPSRNHFQWFFQSIPALQRRLIPPRALRNSYLSISTEPKIPTVGEGVRPGKNPDPTSGKEIKRILLARS
jgi:hypothetical protein